MSTAVAWPPPPGSLLRVDSSGSCRGFHPLGGVTRILIIDDEAKPAQALLPHDNGGHEQVHEFQIATPVPPDVEDDHAPAIDPDSAGSQDTSMIRELIARVEELLRQTRGLPAGATTGLAGTIRFGSVLLEPSTQTVLRGGQPVRVTHTEFRLR